MNTLQLPPTLRIARPDEVPNSPGILERISESREARIEEGYVFMNNETHDLPFKFFAEINVDNHKLWSLFKCLLLQLPDQICLVFNHKDEEPVYTGYSDKYNVLNKLEMFQLELTQDGLIEIGALYNDDFMMEEVFIRSPKYLQYWGTDEYRFRQTMLDFELYEEPKLKFIDEYPLVTEALRLHRSDARDTTEVLGLIGKIISNGQ